MAGVVVLNRRWLPDLHQTIIDAHAIVLTDTGAFIDAEHGWLWSRHGFAHTDDGGRSWQCLTYPRS